MAIIRVKIMGDYAESLVLLPKISTPQTLLLPIHYQPFADRLVEKTLRPVRVLCDDRVRAWSINLPEFRPCFKIEVYVLWQAWRHRFMGQRFQNGFSRMILRVTTGSFVWSSGSSDLHKVFLH